MIKLRPVNYRWESEGVWVDYYNARLKIASTDALEYQADLQASLRKANGLDYGDLRSQHSILAGVAARTLLKDWEIEDDGEKVPYTSEEAEKVLLDDYKTFKFIVDFAHDEANYKEQERKKIAKKPQTRSGGTSSTEKTLSS